MPVLLDFHDSLFLLAIHFQRMEEQPNFLSDFRFSDLSSERKKYLK
jgi:hypothetical protein